MKTKNMTERKSAEAEIRERFECLQGTLTERNRRLFAGSEALAFGYGGITAVSRATGLSPRTVRRGLKECQEIELGVVPNLSLHRSRRPGGGRKKLTQKHPQLLPTLQELVESTTRGDPESPLLWTARSQRNLVAATGTGFGCGKSNSRGWLTSSDSPSLCVTCHQAPANGTR
jgi:hypothetical protein